MTQTMTEAVTEEGKKFLVQVNPLNGNLIISVPVDHINEFKLLLFQGSNTYPKNSDTIREFTDKVLGIPAMYVPGRVTKDQP